jgi:ribonuclease HI
MCSTYFFCNRQVPHRARMANTKKYYTVWKGRTRGVFDTWERCLAQVHGYPGAQYKAFPSREAAQLALGQPYEKARPAQTGRRAAGAGAPERNAIAVDASCPGNPGPVEFRGVDIGKCAEVFRQGPLANGTNNIGEFLAIVHALGYLQQRNLDWPIYTDSKIAIGWVRHKQCRTKLIADKSNASLFQQIRRAEVWLRTNQFRTRIVKWETEAWGENPADFGRK